MKKQNSIPLFYWSERKFLFKDKENYGDLLGKYLVERISGRTVKWVHPKKQKWYKRKKTNYLTVGSIIHHSTRDSIVWGSGIIDRKQFIAPADFRAVRGPRTREFLLMLGYQCPEIYGDPAILLPRYFHPDVKKKFEIGIIPHYHDYKKVAEIYSDHPEIKVIDLMTLDIEKVTIEILQCKRTLSSSLHGLVVSHSYNIPSVWVEFSDKLFGDGVKFEDYLESVNISSYYPAQLEREKDVEGLQEIFSRCPSKPSQELIQELRIALEDCCPFK